MPSPHLLPLLLLFVLSIPASASASAFVSDDNQLVGQRRLLQLKTPCSVDFENQNYTILTSQCKGPDYSPEPCCSSFKEFACPFADQINDLTSDCADRMFTYITKVGQYPQGLFSSICREDRDGLVCAAPPPPPPTPNAAAPMAGGLPFVALLIFSLHFVV